MLPCGVSDRRFSDTAGLEIYRHSRSSFWRSWALAATPACRLKPADPVGDGMHRLGEFLAGRRLDPTEPGCSIGMIGIHAIEEQHVKVGIDAQRTTEAPDQGDRAGTSKCLRVPDEPYSHSMVNKLFLSFIFNRVFSF